MRKVEAQPVRSDERSSLHDLRAEHAAQGPVQEVRSRVVPHSGGSLRGVDAQGHLVADPQRTEADAPAVNDQPLHGALRVLDLDATIGSFNGSEVADLTAALRIAGRSLAGELHPLGLGDAVGLRAVAEQRGHP